MKIMIYIMPVALLLMAWQSRKSGVVATFISAGAISEATARKPASIGTLHPDFVRRAVQRGTLIDMGDGRYYVDLGRVEQRRKQLLWLSISAAIALVATTIFMAWELWG